MILIDTQMDPLTYICFNNSLVPSTFLVVPKHLEMAVSFLMISRIIVSKEFSSKYLFSGPRLKFYE